MTPQQHARVRDLFEGALDRDPASRIVWAARQAEDDEAVQAEVLSLLEHDARAGEFMADPLVAGASEPLVDDAPLEPGSAIGDYTVIQEIGRAAGWAACTSHPTDVSAARSP